MYEHANTGLQSPLPLPLSVHVPFVCWRQPLYPLHVHCMLGMETAFSEGFLPIVDAERRWLGIVLQIENPRA